MRAPKFRGKPMKAEPVPRNGTVSFVLDLSELLRVEVWRRPEEPFWYGVVYLAGAAVATSMKKTPQVAASAVEKRWDEIRADLAKSGIV